MAELAKRGTFVKQYNIYRNYQNNNVVIILRLKRLLGVRGLPSLCQNISIRQASHQRKLTNGLGHLKKLLNRDDFVTINTPQRPTHDFPPKALRQK